MAEYIKRNEAIAEISVLISRVKRNPYDSKERTKGVIHGLIGAVDRVGDIPAADVVAVVRCKDCKHRYVPTRCALWYATVDDTEYFVERGDDFYCSYGEAKMDGKGDDK